MGTAKEVGDAARLLGKDVFLYSGPITRQDDFLVYERLEGIRVHDEALLILVTNGGDPDAAYKIARCLHKHYTRLTVLIPGMCKSAGTLVVIGAHEIAFMPYGELGPLDIQLTKVDRFEQMQSGLIITESLDTIEQRMIRVFLNLARDLMSANPGLISFPAASQVAVEAAKAIYGPVAARIDPEEIGARSRAMRIAQDYGERLASVSENLKADTLQLLAEKYSSHSFVIDEVEAGNLFNNVRSATEHEAALVALLGGAARKPSQNVNFFSLHNLGQDAGPEHNNDDAIPEGPAGLDGGNPAPPDGEAIAQAEPDAPKPAAPNVDGEPDAARDGGQALRMRE